MAWSTIHCRNRIGKKRDANEMPQQTIPTLAAYNNAVRHESSQSHDQTKQKFLRTTADTDKKAINKTTTKQGQDKSQLYSVALEYLKVYIDYETNLRHVFRHTISPSRSSIVIIVVTIYTG